LCGRQVFEANQIHHRRRIIASSTWIRRFEHRFDASPAHRHLWPSSTGPTSSPQRES
jgi:hypothetical protein